MSLIAIPAVFLIVFLERLILSFLCPKKIGVSGKPFSLLCFPETYPSWGPIHVLSIRTAILLEENALFLNDSEVPRHYPYQRAKQKNPGGAGYSYAYIR